MMKNFEQTNILQGKCLRTYASKAKRLHKKKKKQKTFCTQGIQLCIRESIIYWITSFLPLFDLSGGHPQPG